MTNFEMIKQLDFDEMASLLVWGMCYSPDLEVPSCDEGCEDYDCGCAGNCPHEKRERAVRGWLEKEYEE